MNEVIERFLESAKEYFADITIDDSNETSVTITIEGIDSDYAIACLQAITEDLAGEFVIETTLDPTDTPTYVFSFSELLD